MKQEYDSQCRLLEKQNGGNSSSAHALEFGVRAQAHLQELQNQAEEELNALHLDYQQKMDKMRNTLDEKWRRDNPDKTVQYKVYLHK